jgi:hypothetical protein
MDEPTDLIEHLCGIIHANMKVNSFFCKMNFFCATAASIIRGFSGKQSL